MLFLRSSYEAIPLRLLTHPTHSFAGLPMPRAGLLKLAAGVPIQKGWGCFCSLRGAWQVVQGGHLSEVHQPVLAA